MPPELITPSPVPPDLAQAEEAAAWRPVEGSWRPLYGSFPGEGMSVEWHDFETEKPFDWSRSFHAPSLEICLNFSGEARFGGNGKGEPRPLAARQAALYTTGKTRLAAQRLPGMRHRFVTIELSAAFLEGRIGALREGVRDDVRRFLDAPKEAAPILEIFPLPTALLALREQLLEPPVPPAARSLWYPAKVAEVMGQILFKAQAEAGAELFCERRKKQMRERIDHVLFLLKRDLENPPTLEMLAKEVGCSSFYLSRTFSQAVGMTLPQYLRRVRIERAAELLRAGGKTVTEVAFEVGYTSLSAFNTAFVELVGCCPGLYPMAMAGKLAKRPLSRSDGGK